MDMRGFTKPGSAGARRVAAAAPVYLPVDLR